MASRMNYGLPSKCSSFICVESVPIHSRAFLYTTIGYKLVQIIMERAIAYHLLYFISHPTVAFCSYCAQTLVIGGFLAAMSTLLVLVYRSACPAVRRKIGKSYL